MATNQSALDSLVARASDEEMSVEEYLRHLLALESALFESVIAEGEASLKTEGSVPLKDAVARLKARQKAASQSA